MELLVGVASSSGSGEGETRVCVDEEEDAMRGIYSRRAELPLRNLRPTVVGCSPFNGHGHDSGDRGHVSTVFCTKLGKRAEDRRV